jgi:hypothetical protein
MFHHHSSTSTTPQDSLQSGVLSVMGDETGEGGPSLAVYESVSCLECGTVYAKPSRGGTARSNPGCPDCGYVGWVPSTARLTVASPRDRSGGDPLLRLSSRSG